MDALECAEACRSLSGLRVQDETEDFPRTGRHDCHVAQRGRRAGGRPARPGFTGGVLSLSPLLPRRPNINT